MRENRELGRTMGVIGQSAVASPLTAREQGCLNERLYNSCHVDDPSTTSLYPYHLSTGVILVRSVI